MSNAIRSLTLHDHRLDPAEAEIRVVVAPEHLTPTTELRGRFVGPRCPGRTTLELAYPLRPPTAGSETPEALTARVIIPDPCFWTAESPYCYEGKVELWQDGKRCDERPIALRLGKISSATTP